MANPQHTNNRATFSVVRDLLLEGSPVRVAVKGQSMLPFFRSGETILIDPIRDEDFQIFNVVFADTGRNFVVHRIIALNGDEVTLLGDGNIIGTEQMHRTKVYGIVRCSKAHLFFAKIWFKMRPLRRYPLAILRRITPK